MICLGGYLGVKIFLFLKCLEYHDKMLYIKHLKKIVCVTECISPM